MNKKIVTLIPVLFTFLSAAGNAHAFITDLSSITQPLWRHTCLPSVGDPAFELSPTLHTLPGLPATSTLFFSRTPILANLSDLLDTDSSFFIPYKKHVEAVTVQEHTLGMQLGQQWQQDHWEVSWQWWLGLRERNVWLPSQYRKELKGLIADKVLSEKTMAPWHASAVRAGIGDVHLTARYRLPLGPLGNLSLGAHWVVPIGTKKQRKQNDDANATLPTTAEPFFNKLSLRVRDMLLCAPFGANGHAGMGLSANLKLNMGGNFYLFGDATSIRFKADKEKRFGLSKNSKPPVLHIGDLDAWSDSDEVTTYAHTYVFPKEQDVTVTPGALHCASIHLAYTTPETHLAAGYRFQRREDEESELATSELLRSMTEQHQVALTGSATNRHDWGESSSYITATYTFAGAQQGTWSIGFGATVQA